MNKKPLFALLATLLSGTAFAHNLTVGDTLPAVKVADKGEITLQDDKIVYQDWNSEQLAGKVRVIQAIAGRSSAKALNADLISAITAADFPDEKYQTTTIINQDDAIWGTGSFVKSSAEDSKREFSWSSMVLDANGTVHQSWQLAAEDSAIIVLDKSSQVLFVKEGKLSSQEIEQALELVKSNF
ncbi:YtfJ family protein [Photobacterium sp. ZSDE20]|uniref:YtfJ family protein n=1 Tax=Photobacterium pectinilyticum TaxID=2906793 RepID=A0ABT1N832_9GAMM|nr:YtfJ family protein [Photobacterium sp. ZSDE20]MCQ1060920.1 YtfJ family protein [Photobacterium sp. ZSDE20]MDD1828788.1 YtfJ family protein [Photobacterium sp. ZSDE20]